MKIVIITDSLGCPRKDTRIEDTWVYKYVSNYKNNNIIYPMIQHERTIRDIDTILIGNIKPDLIILQVGIVDCCRRTIKRGYLRIISIISIISKIWRKYASKNHYKLTKRFKVQYVSPQTFESKITALCNDFNAKVMSIAIASPGKHMKETTYDIENDINSYNKIIKKIHITI